MEEDTVLTNLIYLDSYRSAGPSSWSRQMCMRGVWLLKLADEYLHVRNVLSTIVAFLVAVGLLPLAAVIAGALYVVRRLTSILLGHFYPSEVILKTNSLRSTLDTPRCPGVCNVLFSVDGTIEIGELKSRVSECMSSAPPSAQCKLKSRLGWYLWRSDPSFDVSRHVHTYRGLGRTKPVTDNNIQSIVSELCSRPFPSDRSPWEIVLIPVVSSNSSAILIRIHHLLAEEWPLKHLVGPASMDIWEDGVNMPLLNGYKAPKELAVRVVHLVRSQWSNLKQRCDPYAPLTESKEEKISLFWASVRLLIYGIQRVFQEVQKFYEYSDSSSMGRSTLGRCLSLLLLIPSLLRQAEYRITSFGVGVKKLAGWIFSIPFLVFIICFEAFMLAVNYLRSMMNGFKSLGRSDNPDAKLVETAFSDLIWGIIAVIHGPILLIRRIFRSLDPVPLLQGRSWSGRRVLAWADPVPREVLNNIGAAAAASEADVLLAACAGVLRHYFRTLGTDIPEWVSATVPIGLSLSKDNLANNVQGFTVVSLPTGESNPRRRLRKIVETTTKIRNRPERFALSVFLLNQTVNLLPQPILTSLLNFLSYKHPVTVSQIKLPTVDPKIMPHGRRVSHIRYWRPGQGNIGLSFTLLSYSDHVALAVASDREVLPQPAVITSQFAREVYDMALAHNLHLNRQSLIGPRTKTSRSQTSS